MKNILSYATANKTNTLLSSALGVQLFLAGGLYWLSTGQGEFTQAQTIASFDPDAADTLTIEDGEATLTLVRIDDDWQVSGERTIPADTAAVVGVLESLSHLEAGLPVATTESSQAQLEVAEDEFQRKLTIMQGEDELAQMYLGTSPGFRKAHVRLEGENAIHAAKINVFDFKTSEEQWLDRQHFAFSDVTDISGDGYTVHFENNAWQIVDPENMQETHVVDAAVADNMVSSLEQLALTGIYKPSEHTSGESEAQLRQVSLTVQVEGKPVVLSMVKQDDKIYVERDDREGRFTVSNSVFDTFSKFTAESLLVESTDASVN